MPPANRRPGQSWRTFLRNQALAFSDDQDLVDESARADAGLRIRFYRDTFVRFPTPVIGTHLTYDHGHPLPALNAQPISPRSAPHHRGLWDEARRPLVVSGRSWRAISNRGQVTVPMRGPPYHTRASPVSRLLWTQAVKAVPALVKPPALQYDRSNWVNPPNPPFELEHPDTPVAPEFAFMPAWTRF
jgi:hypothetical protein